MPVEWSKDTLVIMEVARGVFAGRWLTAQERAALAERFGISEEVLLRYERAKHAYHHSISRKQWDQAWIETADRMRELGKRLDDPAAPGEFEKVLHRIQEAAPENEITRERDDALAALRAALAASTETKGR